MTNRYASSYSRIKDPGARYDQATKDHKKDVAQGFITTEGDLNFGQGSDLARYAQSAKTKFEAETQRGTDRYKVRKKGEADLLRTMDRFGTYSVSPRKDAFGRSVGSVLTWTPRRKDGPFKAPVPLVTSPKADARVSDFQRPSGAPGFVEDPAVVERNLFVERFHDLYFTAFGEHLETYPTADEMNAYREYGKKLEAWRIHKAGDPRQKTPQGKEVR